jgi:hypothetical protein
MFRKAALLWIMTAPLACAFQASALLIRFPSSLSLFESSLEDHSQPEDSQEQASQKKKKKKGIYHQSQLGGIHFLRRHGDEPTLNSEKTAVIDSGRSLQKETERDALQDDDDHRHHRTHHE